MQHHRYSMSACQGADFEPKVPSPPLICLVICAQAYQAHGGLAVNWDVFGSSGHTARPPGGTLKSYW